MIVSLHGGPAGPNGRMAHRVERFPGDVLDLKIAAWLGYADSQALYGTGAVSFATCPPPPTEHVVRFRLSRTDPDGHHHYVFTGEIDP